MGSYTTYLGFLWKPTVGDTSVDSWGTLINAGMDSLDAWAYAIVSSVGTMNTTIALKVSASAYTAKGTLLVGSAASTPTALAIGGTNGHSLVVDSTAATGVAWAAATGGGATVTVTTFAAADLTTAGIYAMTSRAVIVGLKQNDGAFVLPDITYVASSNSTLISVSAMTASGPWVAYSFGVGT